MSSGRDSTHRSPSGASQSYLPDSLIHITANSVAQPAAECNEASVRSSTQYYHPRRSLRTHEMSSAKDSTHPSPSGASQSYSPHSLIHHIAKSVAQPADERSESRVRLSAQSWYLRRSLRDPSEVPREITRITSFT